MKWSEAVQKLVSVAREKKLWTEKTIYGFETSFRTIFRNFSIQPDSTATQKKLRDMYLENKDGIFSLRPYDAWVRRLYTFLRNGTLPQMPHDLDNDTQPKLKVDHSVLARLFNGFKKEMLKRQVHPDRHKFYDNAMLKLKAFLDSRQVQTPKEINLKLLTDYLSSQSALTYRRGKDALFILQEFCDYLKKKEKIVIPIKVKNLKQRRRDPVNPTSTYSTKEINKVLGAIDQTTPIGKRDYALIAVAVTTGMRISDCLQLTVQDIQTENRLTTVIQTKTGTPVEVHLLDSVRNALNDYVKNGRPPSPLKALFLASMFGNLPMTRQAAYKRAEKYFKAAKVQIRDRQMGFHTFRATYITRGMEESVPIVTIQALAGQATAETTKKYANLSMSILGACVVPLPNQTSEK
jgi:integrase/recombinase XerD